MAVLAGTVAGVTVTQLNKNTDGANDTQANNIAKSISELIIDNTLVLPDTIKAADATAARTKIQEELLAEGKAYGGLKFIAGNAAPTAKAQFGVVVNADGIFVCYKGKQANKNYSWKVDEEGTVTKVINGASTDFATPLTTDPTTQTDTTTPDPEENAGG